MKRGGGGWRRARASQPLTAPLPFYRAWDNSIPPLTHAHTHIHAPNRDLALTAGAAGLPVAWAAKQPILALAYLAQYAPSACGAIMRSVGPARAAGLEEGKGGYDVGGLARAGVMKRKL